MKNTSIGKIFFKLIFALLFTPSLSYAQKIPLHKFKAGLNMALSEGFQNKIKCAAPDNFTYFQIGNNLKIKVPKDEIALVVPEEITTFESDGNNGAIATMPQNVGCQEAPMRAIILSIKPENDDPSRTFAFRARNPNQTGTTVAIGLNRLRDNPPSNCQLDGDILSCTRNEQYSGRDFTVIYRMIAEKSKTQTSGAPTFMKCILLNSSKSTCSVSDNPYPDATYEVHSNIITPYPNSSVEIEKIQARVRELVERYVVN